MSSIRAPSCRSIYRNESSDPPDAGNLDWECGERSTYLSQDEGAILAGQLINHLHDVREDGINF